MLPPRSTVRYVPYYSSHPSARPDACSQDHDGFPVCTHPRLTPIFEDVALNPGFFPFSLGSSLPSPRLVFIVDPASNVRFLLWQPLRNS